MKKIKEFIKKTCPICSSVYEVNKKNKRAIERSKTCGNKECMKKLALKNTNYTITCKCCKKIFVGKRYNQRFCSPECQKARYQCICTVCKNIFYSKKNTTKTCSHKCRWKLNNQQKITLICDYCDKEFSRPTFTVRNSNVFCSKSCNNKFFVELNYGTTNKYGKNWSRFREYVFDMYSYRCQTCFKEGDLSNLRLHHIIPFRFFNSSIEANQMVNLIPLCNECHVNLHRKYDKWLNKEFGKKIWSDLYSDIERVAEMTIPHDDDVE